MTTDPALRGDDTDIAGDEQPPVQEEHLLSVAPEPEVVAEPGAVTPELEAVAEPGSDATPEPDETAPEIAAIAADLDAIEPPAAPTDEPEGTATDTPADTTAEPIADTPAEPLMTSEAEGAVAEQPTVAFEDRVLKVLLWPFVVYELSWLAFAAMTVWQLLILPEGVAVFESPAYPFIVASGLALTLAGPAVILGSWAAAKSRSSSHDGLFTMAAVRGSAATLLGALAWWTALIAVDFVRLGRLF